MIHAFISSAPEEFSETTAHRASTLLTIRIVFIQIFLDIVINACAFLTPPIFNESPSNILGSYIRVISSLNGCICSLIFAQTIERMKKQVSNSVRLVGVVSSSPKTKTVP
uniref:Uncharacterized protein n=1 Tax=Panagrolaimus davidi TaxID=227884 RepID=A0A914QNL8_9BILA